MLLAFAALWPYENNFPSEKLADNLWQSLSAYSVAPDSKKSKTGLMKTSLIAEEVQPEETFLPVALI